MGSANIPLGNLLAVAHCLPELCPSGNNGVYATLCYLSQVPLQNRDEVASVWPMCRELVLTQHPALQAVTLPVAAIQAANWAWIWAWLDQTELRLGSTLHTHHATDGDWYRYGYEYVPKLLNSEGTIIQLAFVDPPIKFL